MLQRVTSRFCVEKFLSHSTETFRSGTLLCCVSEIFPVAKNLWIRGEGVSRFSFENFLSHGNKKIRREHLCAVFQKISGSEKVYG